MTTPQQEPVQDITAPTKPNRASFIYKLLLWLAITAYYSYQLILRAIPNIMHDSLTHQFALNVNQFGSYCGAFLMGYVLAHIPMGLALDRFSIKWVVPVSILLCMLGLVPFLFDANYSILFIGRLVSGIGASASVLGAFKIIRTHFPTNRFSLIFSLCVTVGLLSMQYLGPLIASTINDLRQLTTIMLILGAIIAIAIYLLQILMKNESSNQETIMSSLIAVLTNYRLIGVSIMAGLMVGPLEGFADAWGSIYFIKVYQMHKAEAISTSLSIYTGMAIGLPLISYFGDKTRLYYTIIVLCALTMALSFWLIVIELIPPSMLNAIMFLVGLMCAYQILTLYKASSYEDPKNLGIATSVINMIVMAIGAIFPNAIGKLIEYNHTGSGEYLARSYTKGIAIIPTCLLIAAIGFVIIGSCEMIIKRRKKIQ